MSASLKILILELAFKEMTDSVTHSDSFRITVQSLGAGDWGPQLKMGWKEA